MRVLAAIAMAVALYSSAQAQEMSPASQRALIISSMAQQLGQSEMQADALKAQLAQANKQIDDLKAKCGDACKDTPNK